MQLGLRLRRRTRAVPPSVHPLLLALQPYRDSGCMPGPGDVAAWDRIVTEASAHGLSRLLHRWIGGQPPGAVPLVVVERVKEALLEQTARTLLLEHELREILHRSAQAEIRCVPLRGLALAEQLYGDVAARPMGDLDLLVPSDSLPRMAELLEALDFREVEHRPGFARQFSYTLSFMKDRHGWIIVEPHWTIAYPPFADSVDMEAVWNRCVRRQVLGIETWALGREDLLLHLSFHYLHYGDNAPLLWLYELDRLIRQDHTAPNWAQVVRLVAQMEQDMLLAEVLRRLTDTFNTPVPDDVFSQLAMSATRVANRSTAGALSGRIVRALAGMSHSAAREQFALLFALKGTRLKYSYVCALLFPSPAFMLVRYGLTTRRQLAFSYLTRVAHIAWEGVKGLVGLFLPHRMTRPSVNKLARNPDADSHPGRTHR